MSTSTDRPIVVITGASSGIGRATALAFARRGSRLVLAARRQDALEQAAADCRELGAEAVSQQVDVGEEAEVESLARLAVDRFGGIDIWFNNAGIDAFGSFEEIPSEAFGRIIQTNLMGTVHGARAALSQFRRQGTGVLINNASIAGVCPMPFHSAYVASKFAIRGFSHALRQELAAEPGIHVCTVCPSSIDTPLWQRSANYSGRKIKPLDPVHPVEQVAGVVVDLARAPQREVFAGASGWVLSEQHAAAPELTEGLVGAFATRDLFQDASAEPSHGSIFKPEPGDDTSTGGWLAPDRPGIPAGDLPTLFAAPGLLAFAPAAYSWKLSTNLAQQFSRQMRAFGLAARPPAGPKSET